MSENYTNNCFDNYLELIVYTMDESTSYLFKNINLKSAQMILSNVKEKYQIFRADLKNNKKNIALILLPKNNNNIKVVEIDPLLTSLIINLWISREID